MNHLRSVIQTILLIGIFASTSSVEAQTPKDMNGQALETLLLGSNFFKIQDHFKDIKYDNQNLAHVLGKAYVALLSRKFDETDTLLSLADRLIKNSTEKNERLAKLVIRLRYKYLDATAQYLAYATYLRATAQSPPQAGLNLLAKRATSRAPTLTMPNHAVFLPNIGRKGDHILVDAEINGRSALLIVDTGGYDSLIPGRKAEYFGLPPAAQNFGSRREEYGFRYGFTDVKEMKLGKITFSDTHVAVSYNKTFSKGFVDQDGLLGFQQLLRLNHLVFPVKNNHISGIGILKTKEDAREAPPHNLFVYHWKPYVRAVIGGSTFSCVLDTGAPRSAISDSIFKRFKAKLKLKKGKKIRSRLLGSKKAKRFKTVKSLPISAGGMSFRIPNVSIRPKGAPDDFCFLGRDAILASGGMQLDFVNMSVKFGPIDETLTLGGTQGKLADSIGGK